MKMKILDVGQCGFDGPRMAALWREELGAIVDSAASGNDALSRAKAKEYDIILVNRVLAGDGSSGLEVIKTLVSSGIKSPVMLVSDLAEAQDQATAAGAVRGFGKAELNDQKTIELLRQAVGDRQP